MMVPGALLLVVGTLKFVKTAIVFSPLMKKFCCYVYLCLSAKKKTANGGLLNLKVLSYDNVPVLTILIGM